MITGEDIMNRLKLQTAEYIDQSDDEAATRLEAQVSGWGFDTEDIYELAHEVCVHHILIADNIKEAFLGVFNTAFVMGATGMQEIETQRVADAA